MPNTKSALGAPRTLAGLACVAALLLACAGTQPELGRPPELGSLQQAPAGEVLVFGSMRLRVSPEWQAKYQRASARITLYDLGTDAIVATFPLAPGPFHWHLPPGRYRLGNPSVAERARLLDVFTGQRRVEFPVSASFEVPDYDGPVYLGALVASSRGPDGLGLGTTDYLSESYKLLRRSYPAVTRAPSRSVMVVDGES